MKVGRNGTQVKKWHIMNMEGEKEGTIQEVNSYLYLGLMINKGRNTTTQEKKGKISH